jgi:hypothetical protein
MARKFHVGIMANDKNECVGKIKWQYTSWLMAQDKK